ncbi:T9SS type A sorting domain-containing protein [Lewinella sp. W8]|uniref:T9SS type A sorting domain-containing protein n=1 Tax=Lewinella sp. W8 TaxID=2528208 RepID=UPI001067CF1A|nr:T9SS type A sorting domain-containing protein [Lewinella sp. W8]MTB53384.1 T9SS type A sorting domain-containing protein [Lewinella sp. W8]
MLNRLLPLFFLLICFASGLRAQDCRYQLLMEDLVSEDGWNGGELTITVAGVPSTYTLTEELGEGRSFSVFFDVNNGDEVVLGYARGPFPEETSFSILNNADSLIFRADTAPENSTNVFSFTAACVDCAPPPAASIVFSRVRFNSAEVNFQPSSSAADPVYLFEYGTGDYDPEVSTNGESLTTQDTFLRINDLESDVLYTFWLSTICRASDDTTVRRGPFQIVTQKEKDVGIAELMSPMTGCDLGSEEVTIGIRNYGGAPQQFFNVDFTINGNGGGVSRPADGIFTGVVGVDSIEFFTFDVRAFLTTPGDYEFKLWTELEGDQDPTNDTLSIIVRHVPVITEFPYVENFENNDGFWRAERAGRGPVSWQWGTPQGTFINRAPQGSRAWVTNLRGNYFNNEESYLISPCFDLTDMEEDPLFSAIMYIETEENFDEVYLEMTTDRGENWRRVETSPADIRWYNDRGNQWWEGDGGFGNGPSMVAQLLSGAAGNEIQLRYVFSSGRSDVLEGVLVDAVSIGERAEINLAALQAGLDAGCIAFDNSNLNFTVVNLGTTIASDFTVNYTLNGTDIISEPFPGSLLPGEQSTFTFTDPLNGGAFPDGITAWVSIAGDVQLNNDTTFLSFPGIMELPFYEDFENGQLPDSWALDGDAVIGQRAGSPSVTLYDTFNDTDSTMLFFTATYGDLSAQDTLRFDVALEGDGIVSLRIDVDFCDVSTDIFEIDTLVAGTYAVAVTPSANGLARFGFYLERESGEVTVDFDNINIVRCPESLSLTADVIAVTDRLATDGAATIFPGAGTPPYTFDWNTGDTEQTLDGLARGPYQVVVTDVLGCTDTIRFDIDLTVDTDDPEGILADLQVFPNPTSGMLLVQLQLEEAAPLSIILMDVTGRQLRVLDFGRNVRLDAPLDLSAYPAGLYFLQLRTVDASRTLRVIRR